jgi:ATP-dependent helicase Lhr and Lhr-like helicase
MKDVPPPSATTQPDPADQVFDRFSAATRSWFTGAFAAPTPAQAQAWESIGSGQHTLVIAPTGSGKTLAAFLWSLDRLAAQPPPDDPKQRCRVLYISPLKALAVDIERNLRAPLAGLRQAAHRLGLREPDIRVAIRSGDTAADERRRLSSHPPDILITTPESLFLLLTSRARDMLRSVETVIVDEVHAVAGSKRGAHLALSLERLEALQHQNGAGGAPAIGDAPSADGAPVREPQRIGLSATVRPAGEVATFLGGGRPVTVVQPPYDKRFDLEIVVPVEDMTELDAPPGSPGPTGSPGAADPGSPAPGGPPGARRSAAGTGGGASDGAADGHAAGFPVPGADGFPVPGEEQPEGERRRSIWPHVEDRVLSLIEQHRSTIVFANSRRLSERLCAALNELAYERATERDLALDHAPAELMGESGASRGAPAEVVRAHHGSVSKSERAQIEEELKSGRLPAVVATSSLELGIDMGAVDLVVQVEPPPSVASGLQRIGRAGHQVGEVSRGVIFPKYRGDLVPAAVTAERMASGGIEELRFPRNPLDVLAQQIIAMTAMDDWDVAELERVVRRAAPFGSLSQQVLYAVLDMLSGRYPSEEFAGLRPRLVWDRVDGTLRGRPGSQRLAVTSGGTIPDRGLFGVFLAGKQTSRVGELDEEMVYESRVGDVFVLGASSWRIEDITADRVLVSPAPGQPGRLPFWHGDAPGRPAELGRAVGAFCRELAALEPDATVARARDAGLDQYAAANLAAYLAEQRQATGHVPDDRTLVVERFRDELGDWRVVIHSPYGARVHAPWALAIASRLRERYGDMDVQALHTDDGIILRIPETESADAPQADAVLFDPDEIEQAVVGELGGSALFASRFRECAARALLLPRRRPDRRTPLWQQRQRAAQLLAVAGQFGSFPIVLETVRECVQDVFDVPALTGLMRDLTARRVRVAEVETAIPSPFARSLLFRYVGAFMYEGDAPLAERRAQALALDSALLAELLGDAGLRELLDPEVLAEAESQLQRLAPDRHARDVEGVADLLRTIGPLSADEVAERCDAPAAAGELLAELFASRRAIEVRVSGEPRWAAVEDAGRLRDALGVPLPVGVPEAFTEPVPDPLGDLVARYARTHGPFTAGGVAARYGLGIAVADGVLRRLGAEGRMVSGEFRPGGRGTEWCDAGVLRMLRRRSLARLRKEVEPSPPEALARLLPAWQHVRSAGRSEGNGRSARSTPSRGAAALADAIEQLQGAPVPASALETLVLPSRVPGYSPAMLDELTTAGEVTWAGAGALPGSDGWLMLAPADVAPLLLPEPSEITTTPVHDAVLAVLEGGGALFFRMLADRVTALLPGDASPSDTDIASAVWDLVWAGQLSNDTLAPLRTLLGSGRGPAGGPARRAPRPPRSRFAGRRFPGSLTARTGGSGPGGGAGAGRPAMPSRSGPPTVSGRWWLLPARETDPTRRAHAFAETLLDRHGVLTRGAVAAERVPGGFAAVYPVLRALEESGRCRRGYFVEGLGAAQFALPGAVDRLRAFRDPVTGAPNGDTSPPGTPWAGTPGDGWTDGAGARAGAAGALAGTATEGWAAPPGDLWTGPSGGPWAGAAGGPWTDPPAGSGPRARRDDALVLAAADPANPYGAALPWPARPDEAPGGHKPGRKAGALVVLVAGHLVLYVERGGRTLLSWADDPELLAPATEALAAAVRDGALGRLTVERADGGGVYDSPLAQALRDAGFHPTPRGLRLRG